MFKRSVNLGILLIVILSFALSNSVFAFEKFEEANHYPDYSCEFAGREKCEGFNRKLFNFNLKLNKCIIRPVNIVWASMMPKCAIDKLQNAYLNMNYPIRLVSCLLQKDFKTAKTETVRFAVNTTVGGAGLFDPAKNKLKIEPRDEDMAQVLAHYKVKQGPYLVLPIVRGNIRDLVGQLLNWPLRPLSYIPIAGGIANAVLCLNNATYSQPIIKKVDETYADPYEIARLYDGVSRYIKNENLDRDEVLKEKTVSQNIMPVCNTSCATILKPDMELQNYNPQSPMIDSLRTSLFRELDAKKSAWADLSVWNKSFTKQIKLGSVEVEPKHPKYNYRYILQKNKTSPLAILYPSIGEGIRSDHSDIFAKILYVKGYSVVIMGSAFQWEFVKSMPEGYKPGLPAQDAKYLRLVSAKILDSLEKQKKYQFTDKIVVGTSYGAMTALFTGAQEQKEDTLGISKYVVMNPPIELFYALKKLDKDCEDWKCDTSDLKMRTAVAAQKVVKATQQICKETPEQIEQKESEYLPFTDAEAKMIIGFIMKQKLSDVVFTVENQCRGKKCALYDSINKMSYEKYCDKYMYVNHEQPLEQFEYEASLHAIGDFLKDSDKYKIYHTQDDFFTNHEQLAWLKQQSGNKTVIFNNGSHLGFLYRKEFLNEFLKDINLEKPTLTVDKHL